MKITPTELTKLREYFDAKGASYEERIWKDNRYNLHVGLKYVALSFLTSEGSYGGLEGLIEVYNFRDEPTGHLTADEAIEIYEKAESNSNDLVGYRKESEEIEVENTEWLKEEITEILLTSKRDGTNYFYYRDLKEKIYNAIDQLDELEVLSQEWIDEHAKAVTYDEVPDQTEVVYVDDLKELLVPKQKEVKRAQIPEWIIDWYQGANNELSTLEDVFDNLSHDTGYNIVDSEEVRSHIMKYGGFSKMYEALSHIYFGVYEIEEEEQKYYVKDSKGSYILAKIKGEVMTMGEILEFYFYGHELVDIDYNLTEQEIKDYDERFWAFAVLKGECQ